ncbi:MAG TPA: phosphatidate cytidylyltransferase [Pyrinomonadaceae bacterium]|jgi:phosphatidate cytidylyltransferase|nr:phosphatidate cytidylyltransferase [Pyrinomonadaceae bacterium]
MQRIITAAILLPFLIASILVSWLMPLFVLLVAAAISLGLLEFWKLAKKRGMKPDIGVGYLASAVIFTIFFFNEPSQDAFSLLLLIVTIVLLTMVTLAAATFRGAPFDALISSSGATILGVLYVAILGSHLVALRSGFPQQVSAHLLSFFFLVIMGSDTGAYYAGRTFGKHKLAPKISPGKTWEGVIGGVAAGLLMATLSHFWFFRDLPLKWALPLAGVMVVLGIIGDLSESAIKRSAGAKDAANILPGHGGALDRLDSLLFNAPLIYYFGRIYFH